ITSQEAGIRLGAYDRQSNLVAVSWLLWDKERAYYFIAGDTDPGRAASAGILLCQEAIRLAFEEKKVMKFDFCGSMIEPVTDMRRQFGAKAEGLMKIYRSKWKIWELAYTLSR
ncbi:MAG TPA: GNAT family N-acetyltransferase, partial [Saprospiraceae bacterium]|nr:GNAT family N-acetyltransferase [Saprospiraceae bacterium]